MALSVTITGEIMPDHTIMVRLPDDMPIGPVRVTVTVEPDDIPRKLTARELASSEFAGDWADRDDLPSDSESFSEWRRSLSERRSV